MFTKFIEKQGLKKIVVPLVIVVLFFCAVIWLTHSAIPALLAFAFIFFSLIVNKLLYGPSADGERKFKVSFQEKRGSLAYSDVDTTFPLRLAGLKDVLNDRSKKIVEIKVLPPAIANSFHIAIHLCVGTISVDLLALFALERLSREHIISPETITAILFQFITATTLALWLKWLNNKSKKSHILASQMANIVGFIYLITSFYLFADLIKQ